MVNVIVVFPKLEDAQKIRNLLVRNGIDVTGAYNSGAQVMQFVDNLEDGIIVSGYRAADMNYAELRDLLPKEFLMLLVASQAHMQEYIGEDVVYLSMPIKGLELVDTIHDMESQVLKDRKKRREKPKVRNEEEKAVIAHAKEMLMRQKQFTEEEAHRYLQKISMDSGRSLIETCQMFVAMV